MTKLQLNVEGMSCAHCESRVESALSALVGVKKASADSKKGRVKLSFNESLVTRGQIEAAVTEAGYRPL